MSDERKLLIILVLLLAAVVIAWLVSLMKRAKEHREQVRQEQARRDTAKRRYVSGKLKDYVLERDDATCQICSMVTDDGTIPAEVRASMQSAFNYILGVNPVSYCYVSGEGENSVRQIYSGIYTTRAKLDPYRCPDGYVTEGANSNNARDLSKFDGKCYIDSDGEYTTNENTIYGNSSMIFLTATMISWLRTEGDVNADGVCDVLDAVTLQKWLLAIPGAKLTDVRAADLNQDGSADVFDLGVLKKKLAEAGR